MGKRVKGDKLKYLTDRNVDLSRFGGMDVFGSRLLKVELS